MTVPVPDQLEYISDADGVTKDFPYPKRFLQKDEIVVLLRDEDGIDTPQILNTHYTISGSSWPSGGTISFITAPQAPNKVVRYRMTQAKQTVDLENNQRNDAPSVELQLDRLTMAIQDRGALTEATALGLREEVAVRVEGDRLLNARVDQEIEDRIDGDQALSDRIDHLVAPAKWLSGNGAPAPDLGEIDDFYIDEDTGDVYGPKTHDGWGAPTANIKGEKGDKGDPGISTHEYDAVATVQTALVPSSANFISVAGYSAVGDGGAALYKRVAVEPSHAGKVQSADGAWWELAENRPNVKMFGAIGDGVSSDQAAIVAAVGYVYDKGSELYWPNGVFLTSVSIPNLHKVKHFGPGSIKRGSLTFSPSGSGQNAIYINASTGLDSNDGVHPTASAFATLEGAVSAVFEKRNRNVGVWTFNKSASTKFTIEDGRAKSPSSILIPTDFADMSAAFTFLRRYPVVNNDLIQVKFEAGYSIKTGVAFQYDDFSRVEITSDDATVLVDSTFVGVNVTTDPFEANSLFVAFQSKAPRLNCLIDMQTFGGCGVVITNNSDGYIAGNKGVRSAGAYGLYVNTRSSCIAANADFRLAGWGNRVTTNSLLEAPQCNFSQARNATYLGTNNVANLDVSRGSVAYVTGTEAARTNLQGGKGHGLAVRRSFVSATHVDCSQNERIGLNVGAGSVVAFTGSRISSCLQHGIACDGSRIDANETTIINNGSHNLYADSGGEITARNVTCGGAGANSVRAANGSRINVSGGTCRRGTSDDSTDIVVTGGSIVHASGATGGTNITVLSLNAAGIIFK